MIERIFRYLGADQAIGGSRNGVTTKIHAICDILGNPVELDITPDQNADITKAEPLLENIDPDAFLADRAYDADRLIERFLNKINQFRSIATRYAS